MRPTHFTYHREGPPPRLQIQSDAPDAYVRLEFAGRAQLFAPANQEERAVQNYFDSWEGGEGVTGQQLRLDQYKLTYDMPVAVWRRLGQNNHHIFFRATATTQLPPNWNSEPPTTARTVSDSVAANGRAPYFGAPHDRLHAPWPFTDPQALNQVPAGYRERLDLIIRHHETHESSHLLRRLSRHDNYTSLPVDQRGKALHVFAATNVPGRRALLQLFGRAVPAIAAGGSPAPAVRNQDLRQHHRTLLDNLILLTGIFPNMGMLVEALDTVIQQILVEVADPHYELNQGTKGTCVPTSVQWIIATYFPAEYVRLMATLLTRDGRATLANNDVATVPPDTFDYDPNEQNAQVRRFLHRSWPERLFQATMMNYARPGLTYSNLRDVFTDNRGGLTSEELVRLIRGLRNRNYVAQTDSNLVGTIVQRLQRPSIPVLTGMRWGPPGPDQGGHMVVSVSADASNITFRNPWGRLNYRVGQQHQHPPRRSTNPSRGEETMTQADMLNWITNIVVEQG